MVDHAGVMYFSNVIEKALRIRPAKIDEKKVKVRGRSSAIDFIAILTREKQDPSRVKAGS